MATILEPKLSLLRKDRTNSILNIRFDVSITKEEFQWLATRRASEVQAICAIYGKDEHQTDQVLYSYRYDMDSLESLKGAHKASTKALPVSFSFRVDNSVLDEDKAKAVIIDRRKKIVKQTDEIYAVIYLSLQKGKDEAWESLTPTVMTNILKADF